MVEMGLSQAELARRIGISQPSVNHLLRKGATGSKHLHKIARVLETTPEYLTGESDEVSPLKVASGRSAFFGAPVEPFGHEKEWLDALRELGPKERAAVLDLAKTLARKK